MAFKVDTPINNLGPFLTSINISSIDIHGKTGIPTDELSKLRKGAIKTISAEKLFLISLINKIGIKKMLEGVYPSLKLRPTSSNLKGTKFDSIQDFFNYVEVDVIKMISETTGIAPYRLKKIKYNKVAPLAHELYLIEIATKTTPGTLFNILYKDLNLNSPQEEALLRKLEKEKSNKK
jgi:hypothetical protein